RLYRRSRMNQILMTYAAPPQLLWASQATAPPCRRCKLLFIRTIPISQKRRAQRSGAFRISRNDKIACFLKDKFADHYTGPMDHLKKLIREVPDFPKPGINFYDITTLLKHPEGLRKTVDALAAEFEGMKIDTVVGIEAR